jgi:hypothetical protein
LMLRVCKAFVEHYKASPDKSDPVPQVDLILHGDNGAMLMESAGLDSPVLRALVMPLRRSPRPKIAEERHSEGGNPL